MSRNENISCKNKLETGGCKGDEDKLNTKKIHKNSRDEKSRQISQSREQIYLRRLRHAIQHIDKSSEYS